MPKFDGYEEARKVDDLIDKLLSENPITGENILEWMKFERTISSGLGILKTVLTTSKLPKGGTK